MQNLFNHLGNRRSRIRDNLFSQSRERLVPLAVARYLDYPQGVGRTPSPQA